MLEVFDVKLKEAIYKLPFDKILTLKNVSGAQHVWWLCFCALLCACVSAHPQFSIRLWAALCMYVWCFQCLYAPACQSDC